MAGLDFKADTPKEVEDSAVVAHNSRMGVILFGVYVCIYGSFMGLSAFRPDLMSRPAFFGVNLAVAYGFALIGAAFVMAMVYMKLCRKPS